MEFQTVSVPTQALAADLVALCVFAGGLEGPALKALDASLGGALAQRAKAMRFSAKRGQQLTVETMGKLPAARLLVLGLGDSRTFELTEVRNLAATAVRHANSTGAAGLAFEIPAGLDDRARACQLAAEGALLGEYRFDKYLSADNRPPAPLEQVTLAVPSGRGAPTKKTLAGAIDRARLVARSICSARDFVNEPAGYMTPKQLATEAQEIARAASLTVKVLGPKECAKLGMGMFLAVAKGSEEEARLIHLTYKPKRPRRRIALVGKGVTFDSGGYSLKPSASMEDMKIDMSGAAAVITSIGAIARLGCPHEVHAIAACAENLVSGRAYKLGDVLQSMSGTTVEINNTDAEGRLTLGDAFTYAKKVIEPDEILDFATLTGACMIALGPFTAGVFSNDEALAERWLAAAKRTGEEMWRLPLPDRLREQLKSGIADLKNTGERYGGASTAGLFLKSFVGDTPWLHVDFAGPASAAKDYGAVARGGTGFAVATIIEYLTHNRR